MYETAHHPPAPVSLKARLIAAGEALGAYRCTSWLASRHPRILMYHRFAQKSDARRLGADTLAQHLKILRDRRFNILPLTEVAARLEQGDAMPPHTVVITVDDGYADFHQWAYPVLSRYGAPATIYVTSDFIDGRQWLWPDIVEYILHTSRHRELSTSVGGKLTHFEFRSPAALRAAWSEMGTYCLSVSNEAKLAFIRQIAAELDVTVPEQPTAEYAAMSWDALRQMSTDGIEVGGHTCTHPVLTSLPLPQAESEIRLSKQRIESQIACEASSFAYPNGTPSDYDDAVKSLVRAAGYKSATVSFMDARSPGELFELRRYPMGSDWRRFKNVVFGAEYLSLALRRTGAGAA